MALILALPLAATVAATKSVTTGGITDSSGTITVNSTAHGFSTGDILFIQGAATPGTSGSYNGFVGPITASTDSFTYASSTSSGVAVGSNTTVQGTIHRRSITATGTSAAIVVPKRLVPGNIIRVRASWPAGTFAGSWTLQVLKRVASVRSDGAVADSTYATPPVPSATAGGNVESTFTINTTTFPSAASGGTGYFEFPACEDFKILATKASSATALTLEVLTPSVAAT